MVIQTLKGFRDFLPTQARKRNYVLNTLKEVFELYGFEPLETPALEYEEILTGKYGDEGDKLMYKFEDNGGRHVALRYDQTVPLARVVAQYANDLPLPFKRYQIQNVWRAENTQKGRYREFIQVDVDTVGSINPLADAEIVKVAMESLKRLGFNNFKVLLNDRDVFYVNDYKFDPAQIRIIDKLKKIGRDKVIEELVREGADKAWAENALSFLEQLKKSPPILPIFPALDKLGISKDVIEFTPVLARGLDYYTGMIFEIEVDGYDVGSICGGGRYDNLIGMFSNQQVPAVGFAFGFDRVIEAMDQLGLFPQDLGQTKILVTNTSQRSSEIADSLRKKKINTLLYVDDKELDKQLRYADKKQIPFALIVGDEKLTLKDMKTGEQKEVTLEDLPDAIR